MMTKIRLIGGGRHPEKNYGKVELSDIMPTILATDYKSPSIVAFEYETCGNDLHKQPSERKATEH